MARRDGAGTGLLGGAERQSNAHAMSYYPLGVLEQRSTHAAATTFDDAECNVTAKPVPGSSSRTTDNKKPPSLISLRCPVSTDSVPVTRNSAECATFIHEELRWSLDSSTVYMPVSTRLLCRCRYVFWPRFSHFLGGTARAAPTYHHAHFSVTPQPTL